MCAMLSLIAGKELRIGEKRIFRFVESYIGQFVIRVSLQGDET